MKCPRCGNEFNGDICPTCNVRVVVNENPNNTVVNENVQPVNSPSVQVVNTNGVVTNANVQSIASDSSINPTNNMPGVQNESPVALETTSPNTKKDLSKVYYIILGIAVIVFIALMSIIVFKNFKQEKKEPTNRTSKTTSTPVETVLTKNKGVYTGLGSPIQIGNITFGGLYDRANDKIVDTDVEIVRHLSDGEINTIVSSSGQVLNPGFKWDGVEYRVTLNDFDYLNGESIDPSMKTYLFDTYYKNNFFLVDENYYTITPVYSGGTMIKNGESANLMVAYQVPIEQNYYICFGENFSSLGCFIN